MLINLKDLRMFKKYLLILTLLVAVDSAFAIELNAEPYNGSGAYVNVNAGLGTLQNLPTNSTSFAVNAGYNFNRGFALEAGWTGLFSSQYGATAYNNFADVAVKGTLPLSDLFSLYVRLGGGLNNTGFSGTAIGSGSNCLCNDSGGNNFAWLGGLGGSFALSRNIDLRVEDYMIMPMGGSSNYGNINNIMGGVQYNF